MKDDWSGLWWSLSVPFSRLLDMIEVKQLNTEPWDLCQSPFLRSMQCKLGRKESIRAVCTIIAEPRVDTLLRRYVILPNFQPIQPLAAKTSLQAVKTSPSLPSRTLQPRWLHEPTLSRRAAQPSKTKGFCCAHPTLREMFWTLFMYLTLPQDLSTTQMTQHKMLGFNVGKGIHWTWTPWTIPKHLCLNTGSRFLTVAHLLYSVYSIHVHSVFLIFLAPNFTHCSFLLFWLARREGSDAKRRVAERIHQVVARTNLGIWPRKTTLPCYRWTAWPHAAMNSTPWRLRQDPSANRLVNSFIIQ